jgi:hypothetical protein
MIKGNCFVREKYQYGLFFVVFRRYDGHIYDDTNVIHTFYYCKYYVVFFFNYF